VDSVFLDETLMTSDPDRVAKWRAAGLKPFPLFKDTEYQSKDGEGDDEYSGEEWSRIRRAEGAYTEHQSEDCEWPGKMRNAIRIAEASGLGDDAKGATLTVGACRRLLAELERTECKSVDDRIAEIEAESDARHEAAMRELEDIRRNRLALRDAECRSLSLSQTDIARILEWGLTDMQSDPGWDEVDREIYRRLDAAAATTDRGSVDGGEG